jgi:hypothetical protein
MLAQRGSTRIFNVVFEYFPAEFWFWAKVEKQANFNIGSLFIQKSHNKRVFLKKIRSNPRCASIRIDPRPAPRARESKAAWQNYPLPPLYSKDSNAENSTQNLGV